MTTIRTSSPPRRRCAKALNAFHSMIYFAPELAEHFARHGLTDDMAVYLACRAAPLGEVGPGLVVAAFNAFEARMVAEHVPAIWRKVAPETALATRLDAVGDLVRRLLGDDPPGLGEAAELAWTAVRDCPAAARPMFAANRDVPPPHEPHLLLWHAATLAREYRGDGHVTALASVELAGLPALVTDCASPTGMPKQIVLAKRGWTEADWARTEALLADRGLMSGTELTESGQGLRTELERKTDRLDRAPYERLGDTGTARLTELVEGLLDRAATAGAFPGILRDFFVPTTR